MYFTSQYAVANYEQVRMRIQDSIRNVACVYEYNNHIKPVVKFHMIH